MQCLYVFFSVLLIALTGIPKVRFMSVESPGETTAEGLKKMIEDAFGRMDIENFQSRLASLNVDGASVNMGKTAGLGVRLREMSPWLLVIHCFNHRLELTVKDAFKGTGVV